MYDSRVVLGLDTKHEGAPHRVCACSRWQYQVLITMIKHGIITLCIITWLVQQKKFMFGTIVLGVWTINNSIFRSTSCENLGSMSTL